MINSINIDNDFILKNNNIKKTIIKSNTLSINAKLKDILQELFVSFEKTNVLAISDTLKGKKKSIKKPINVLFKYGFIGLFKYGFRIYKVLNALIIFPIKNRIIANIIYMFIIT